MAGSRSWSRGVVTALKPVRAEQVRRPEWKQNWTVQYCGSVLPICLSLGPVGSIHISCLAAREQTSAAQIAKASSPYNMTYFYSFLALSFNSIFNFFWLKRPSTSARTVVPLTTPLIIAAAGIVCGRVSVTLRCPSDCLFHSPAAVVCGGFAAMGPAGRRYRSIAAVVVRRSSTVFGSKWSRAVSCLQPRDAAEHWFVDVVFESSTQCSTSVSTCKIQYNKSLK